MSNGRLPNRYHRRLRPSAKKLAKRYRSWADDFIGLLGSLQAAPLQGDALGRGCYKVRLAITSKGKGKSGGARVITYVKVVGQTVYLLTVYDKSEREDLAPGELDDLLMAAGLG